MRAAFQLKTKLINSRKIKTKPSHKGHRYPIIIIEEAVWQYFSFALSYREVEVMLAWRAVAPMKWSAMNLATQSHL